MINTRNMAGAEAHSEVELVLLERVFLRIGSAETDDQLQSVLGKFLPPVLLKLASQTDGVRKKVMELLVHINKRVKSRPKIQLPVQELLAQYKDPEASPFVTNFTIIYIKIGFPRLETATQVELLPELVNCLEGRPVPQQDSLLQLITPVLQFVKIPPDPVKSKALFGLNEKPKTAKLMLNYMLDMLLMPYNPPSGQTKPAPGGASPAPGGAGRPASGASTPTTTAAAPAGLSDAAYKRVVGDNPMTPDEIEKIKLGILEFLGGEVFLDQDVVCHLVVAMADNRHAVGSSADRSLKKMVSSVDWNNHAIISKLYSIFQGTVVVKGQTSSVKPDQKRSPGSIQVRIKIFPYLLKSKEAANQFPACVQTVFDCLYGTNTSARLKIMAVQFVHHLCLHCVDTKFNPIGAVLLSGMVKLIGENKKEDPQLRSLAYIAVGKIARRVPGLVTKDITLLQTFFNAMCKEESENRLAVQEALSMMSPAFKKLDPSNLKLVEALLMENIDKPEPYIRQMVVKYAIAVFPPDHIPSRYMLLLACGDTKEDVYAEASKALRGVSQSENRDEPEKQVERKLPQFTDMVNYINEKATQRQKTAHKYVTGNNVLAFNPATYVEILMYLRMCLAHNAGVSPNLESTVTMQTEAPLVGVYVNQLLQDKTSRNVISVYISIIRKLLNAIGGAPAMYCLLEMVAVARSEIASQFTKQLDWIKGFMFSSREDMREYAAQFYALVASCDTGKRQAQVITDLVKYLDTQALEGQHGSLLALGYLIGHIFTSRRKHVGDVTVEEMDVDDSEENDINDNVVKAIQKIVSLLDNTAPLLSGGACTALGEIGRCGALPLPNEGADKKDVSKLSVVENLQTKVQTTKENPKVREKAATALGYLCVGEEEFPYRQKLIEAMLDCAQPKQIELHFTVGESLVCAALGPASVEGRDPWLVTAEDYKTSVGEKTLQVDAILNLLLKKYIPSPNPHIRQWITSIVRYIRVIGCPKLLEPAKILAACIWLMAVIKGCEKQEVIQTKLKDVQAAFMALLSDNDEMTQDFASKGLGVVYEICSKEQKDELVSMLVSTLMTGKRTTDRKVTGDTEVFQDGALGKTPDGKGLSTYKELCSIANDLNQPDLIYKFMHLANHNAMWNSKKGAAFGFSTIAAQAGEQLAPYLHQIVPKLYRYQFDPNPRINQAMTSIWSALVTDNKKTVDKYLKEILDDLMINLTNSQWRVRESSCLALNDALRGRALDDVVDGLPQLWETILRVRDDIKESVRKAADMACKTLSRVSIKICDPNYGSVGERATSLVLPCLLKVGLPSQVQEIRALSLATILKISQNAGALLRPHVPLLVVALLESLSGLEPQYLNYLSLHAASSQVTQAKLDSARLAASKTSPMMQAINQCVQYVDESNLGELVPRLTDLIRSGVGLGTKAGCANFIGSLVHHCPRDLGPYAGKLLGALLNGLNDRNATVKKSYAVTIGYLAKVAKDSSIEKLVLRLKEWYLEKEDESVRHACGLTLQAMGQKSPDTLKRHASIAMPLAFLAMHQKKDADDDSSNLSDSSAIWEEVWAECTPGTEGGIRLYLMELVAISKVALQSQSWPMKAQGAAAMSKMADKLGTNLGPPHLGLLLSALLEGLQGRTWTGKEELLKAIAVICVNCKSSMDDSAPVENQPRVEAVVEAVLKECRKESLPYKQEAVAALGEVLEVQELDRFTEINTILSPLLARKTNDTEDLDVSKDTLLGFQAVAFDCLGQAWPRTKETQDANQVALCKMLGDSLNMSVWKVEVAKLRTCGKVLSRLLILENEEKVRANRETIVILLQHLIAPLCQALGNVKYSAIRTESLNVTEKLVKKLTDCGQLDILDVKEADRLQKALTAMTGDTQPELADRAASLLKTITAATGTSV